MNLSPMSFASATKLNQMCIKRLPYAVYLRALLTLALVALLSSCGKQSTLPKLNAADSVLAFGDSLTEGVGASDGASYPSVLAELTDLNVINEGISGETSAEGLARFKSTLDEHRPRIVILCEGGNDILRNMSQRALKNNLQAMIDIAKANKVAVVLVGVPEKKLFSSTAKLYKELATENDLAFEADVISSLMLNQRYKSDAIHFNDQGYRIMAEKLADVLRANGAL